MILDNFPRVLWINLDRSAERRSYMEMLLDSHGLNHARIKATDGRNRKELFDVCRINRKITLPENACTCSHLSALKYFIDNLSEERIIIFEDDVSFDFLELVPYNWSEFEASLPKDYGMIQLAITRNNHVYQNILTTTNPTSGNYCSAAYLIQRTAALSLLEKYFSKELGTYDLSAQEHATADAMITSVDNAYCIPLFTYVIKGSTIHPMHVYNHKKAREAQFTMWNEFAAAKN